MAYTTIDKPSDYFDTLLSTGDGGSQTFTGLDFQPDWVWSKRRQTHVHQLYDSVRTAGSGKALQSDGNAAEGGDGGTYGYLSSFTSNGFASTAGSSNNNYFNADGGTYVFWNWKAGTSFTNDASSTGIGSIDSAGSVNTTSGFSIVSFTDGGSNATIAHGLGVVPKVIIIKNRAAAEGWYSYWQPLGNNKQVTLNTTSASSTTGMWNNTTPTSTVFSLDTNTGGLSSGNYIAYCFAEKKGYSKFSSYIGNGNVSGTYVHLGFKPAFVLIKKTTGTNGWWGIQDNKREPENIVDKILYANVSDAEYSGANYSQDFLSNGFKIRTAHAGMNESAAPYIYMAFAENPFTTSTGVPATAR